MLNNGWQDIESAPKDGTYVMLYRPCRSHPVFGRWLDYRGSWWSEGLPIEPTHWQPPPAPPALEAK